MYNAAAIIGNPKVAAHGLVVVRGLEKAAKNMDNIKAIYADLSVLHSEKLHVDPDNFKVRLVLFISKLFLQLVNSLAV